MNKSFQESGGTVLSTNWSEVGKEKVGLEIFFFFHLQQWIRILDTV
jgi:suppressor of G2 allele of SKP1